MLEFLSETTLWWHWIVFGIVLLILEMNIGTFFMLGLAVAGVLVGIMDFYIGTAFTTELFVWMVLSVLFVAIWYRWFREKPLSDSGQSNYKLDTLGIVVESIQIHSRGKVTFDTPVLGNTAWHATANEDIDKDTRIKIVKITGQLIEVEPA